MLASCFVATHRQRSLLGLLEMLVGDQEHGFLIGLAGHSHRGSDSVGSQSSPGGFGRAQPPPGRS
jgi:hypothetical protein